MATYLTFIRLPVHKKKKIFENCIKTEKYELAKFLYPLLKENEKQVIFKQ